MPSDGLTLSLSLLSAQWGVDKKKRRVKLQKRGESKLRDATAKIKLVINATCRPVYSIQREGGSVHTYLAVPFMIMLFFDTQSIEEDTALTVRVRTYFVPRDCLTSSQTLVRASQASSCRSSSVHPAAAAAAANAAARPRSVLASSTRALPTPPRSHLH